MLLASAADTTEWGRRRAATLAAGDVVLLFGPLGAGKTTLVRGVARGLGYRGPVQSPTFAILEVYEGRLPIYHFDFFRIAHAGELRAVEPQEYFGQGVTLVEWPERIRPLWPERRIEIVLAFADSGRTVTERRYPEAAT